MDSCLLSDANLGSLTSVVLAQIASSGRDTEREKMSKTLTAYLDDGKNGTLSSEEKMRSE